MKNLSLKQLLNTFDIQASWTAPSKHFRGPYEMKISTFKDGFRLRIPPNTTTQIIELSHHGLYYVSIWPIYDNNIAGNKKEKTIKITCKSIIASGIMKLLFYFTIKYAIQRKI